MTAVAVASAILFGIVVLVGVWYNGKSYGERKADAEARKAEADTTRERADRLESQRAEENEAAREKDLSEAKAASADSRAALDFLVRSYSSRTD